jgi:hypothetical protein
MVSRVTSGEARRFAAINRVTRVVVHCDVIGAAGRPIRISTWLTGVVVGTKSIDRRLDAHLRPDQHRLTWLAQPPAAQHPRVESGLALEEASAATAPASGHRIPAVVGVLLGHRIDLDGVIGD